MKHDVMKLIHLRNGHFQFESGHHGDVWLALELLCLKPDSIRPLARELARHPTTPSRSRLWPACRRSLCRTDGGRGTWC